MACTAPGPAPSGGPPGGPGACGPAGPAHPRPRRRRLAAASPPAGPRPPECAPAPPRRPPAALPAPGRWDPLHVFHRALRFGIEDPDGIDLVVEKVDAVRRRGRGRKHVQEPAPHAELAAAFDHGRPLVPVADQRFGQLFHGQDVAHGHGAHPLPQRRPGREPLGRGRDGRDARAGSPVTSRSRTARRAEAMASGTCSSSWGHTSRAGNTSTSSSGSSDDSCCARRWACPGPTVSTSVVRRPGCGQPRACHAAMASVLWPAAKPCM